MLRLIIGLVKGIVVGGAVGYGAYAAGLDGSFHWVTYGAVGALVGLIAGRPVWSHLRDRSSTVWTAVIKAIFGCGVAVGLYALVAKAWGGFELAIPQLEAGPRLIQDWPFVLGAGIGGLFGAFTEWDDAPPAGEKRKKSKDKPELPSPKDADAG